MNALPHQTLEPVPHDSSRETHTETLRLLAEADEKLAVLQQQYQVAPTSPPAQHDTKGVLEEMFGRDAQASAAPPKRMWSDWEWHHWNRLTVRQKRNRIQAEWARQHEIAARKILLRDRKALIGKNVW